MSENFNPWEEAISGVFANESKEAESLRHEIQALEQEIRALEQAGDNDGANAKRIILSLRKQDLDALLAFVEE